MSKVDIAAVWTCRLRQIADNSAAYGTDSELSQGAVTDAATEIEALCAEVERLREVERLAIAVVRARELGLDGHVSIALDALTAAVRR